MSNLEQMCYLSVYHISPPTVARLSDAPHGEADELVVVWQAYETHSTRLTCIQPVVYCKRAGRLRAAAAYFDLRHPYARPSGGCH